MRWLWDEAKNRANKRKHGVSFEVAALVFIDPLAVSRLDEGRYGEERWQTVGLVRDVFLLVVHTWGDSDDESEKTIGRIISAREATKREKRAYDEGEFEGL